MCLHVIAVIQMKISDTRFRKQKCKLLQKVLKTIHQPQNMMLNQQYKYMLLTFPQDH